MHLCARTHVHIHTDTQKSLKIIIQYAPSFHPRNVYEETEYHESLISAGWTADSAAVGILCFPKWSVDPAALNLPPAWLPRKTQECMEGKQMQNTRSLASHERLAPPWTGFPPHHSLCSSSLMHDSVAHYFGCGERTTREGSGDNALVYSRLGGAPVHLSLWWAK